MSQKFSSSAAPVVLSWHIFEFELGEFQIVIVYFWQFISEFNDNCKKKVDSNVWQKLIAI